MQIPLDFYVPVKDGEPFIADCLNSILGQTVRPQSVTVYLNKFTTDKTAEILKGFSQVRVVEVEVPLSDARNIAIHELESDWIGSIDADVVLDRHWLENLWKHHEEGYAILSGNTKERIGDVGDLFRSLVSPHNWGDHDVINPYMLVPDMIGDRKKILSTGGYQSGWVNYEDSFISRQLKARGELFYYASDAHATHHRKDTFSSCMELRWKHSFQRQSDLFKKLSGLYEKAFFNFAMATLGLSESLEKHHNHELYQISLLLPLHHFVRDNEFFSKNNTVPDSAAKIDPTMVKVLEKTLLEIFGDKADQFWNKALEYKKTNLFEHFIIHYLFFLSQGLKLIAAHDSCFGSFDTGQIDRAIAHLQIKNRFSFSDDVWKSLEQKTRAQSAKIFGKENLGPFNDLSKFPEHVYGMPDSGLIGFRQEIFPDQIPFYTCRDITELVAQFEKKIIWTETFQGSTLIAFETAK